jgi:hypothetical protein
MPAFSVKYLIICTIADRDAARGVFCAPVDLFLNKKNAYQPDIIFITQERKDLIEKKGIFGAP